MNSKTLIKIIALAICALTCTTLQAQDTTSAKNIYVIKLHKEIDKSSAKMFTDALKEA